jgi:hypothetical protein
MTHPDTATFAEFADIARFKRSYVTQLKGDDRLVLTDDGKRVRVAESLERIEATRDPSKAGVVARHAAARQPGAGEGGGTAPTTPPPPEDADDGADKDQAKTDGYQYWRERNERAKALASERDNLVAEGKLMDAAQVEAAVAAAATTLRSRLESLPDVLGPQLAAITDEGQARATLAEAIEHALEECSRQFANIAKQVAA